MITVLNKLCEGKFPAGVKEGKPEKTATLEEVENFRVLLSINEAYLSNLQLTESATEFYESCPLLDKVVDDDLKEDLFYAVKLGFIYSGIPSKLVYLLKKAINEHEAPNLAIASVDQRILGRYLKPGVLPNNITVKQIVTNLIGCDYKTITTARRKAKFKDYYEIYVENVDRIVLVPEDIAEMINSREDLKSINYQKDIGVCMYDTPLRTFGSHLGIVTDEFDLRRCV